MKKGILTAIIAVILSATLGAPRNVFADMEWTFKKQLKMEAAPVDVASSADGKWIYVLTPGEILVYSVAEDKVVNRIPVNKSFDRLTYSLPDNALIVSSSAEKTLQIIQLAVVQHFSLEGLPHQGPEKAAVTLVVFSDYQ